MYMCMCMCMSRVYEHVHMRRRRRPPDLWAEPRARGGGRSDRRCPYIRAPPRCAAPRAEGPSCRQAAGACMCSGRGRVCRRAPQPTAVARAKARTASAFRIGRSRGALEAPQQELEVARAQAVGGLLHRSDRREKESGAGVGARVGAAADAGPSCTELFGL